MNIQMEMIVSSIGWAGIHAQQFWEMNSWASKYQAQWHNLDP